MTLYEFIIITNTFIFTCRRFLANYRMNPVFGLKSKSSIEEWESNFKIVTNRFGGVIGQTNKETEHFFKLKNGV